MLLSIPALAVPPPEGSHMTRRPRASCLGLSSGWSLPSVLFQDRQVPNWNVEFEAISESQGDVPSQTKLDRPDSLSCMNGGRVRAVIPSISSLLA